MIFRLLILAVTGFMSISALAASSPTLTPNGICSGASESGRMLTVALYNANDGTPLVAEYRWQDTDQLVTMTSQYGSESWFNSGMVRCNFLHLHIENCAGQSTEFGFRKFIFLELRNPQFTQIKSQIRHMQRFTTRAVLEWVLTLVVLSLPA